MQYWSFLFNCVLFLWSWMQKTFIWISRAANLIKACSFLFLVFFHIYLLFFYWFLWISKRCKLDKSEFSSVETYHRIFSYLKWELLRELKCYHLHHKISIRYPLNNLMKGVRYIRLEKASMGQFLLQDGNFGCFFLLQKG